MSFTSILSSDNKPYWNIPLLCLIRQALRQQDIQRQTCMLKMKERRRNRRFMQTLIYKLRYDSTNMQTYMLRWITVLIWSDPNYKQCNQNHSTWDSSLFFLLQAPPRAVLVLHVKLLKIGVTQSVFKVTIACSLWLLTKWSNHKSFLYTFFWHEPGLIKTRTNILHHCLNPTNFKRS